MALRLLSYAFLIHNTGSSAEDTVFVQTGASAQLDIQREKLPAEFNEFNWINENIKEKDIIVIYTSATKQAQPHPSYKDRMDFNNETFSLTLKNMQKNDSGVYTAITRNFKEKVIAKHRVSVIDAVKAPVLTVNSIWSSAQPCNFTCTADNLTIINYYNSSCSEDVKSSGIYNLSLKCTDDFIICNHSNRVSWKNDTNTLQQLCDVNLEKITSGASVLLHWLIPLICISLGLLGVVGFCFYKNKKVCLLNAQHRESTVYAEVEEYKLQNSLEMKGSANAHTMYEPAEKEPDVIMATSQTTPDPDSTNQNPPATKSKTYNPVTVYSTVERHPIPPTSESDKTIYAVVKRPLAGCESVN
ncbi:natural killer cell receptor 2B4-like isoform X1 [Triplophysa rosa]|uniref:natural killer cell receptor 2B4-like isoform X1 n=1 Tax=Triplophysa rosa TaxID=992332 RepID=UPI002545C667|nr:natural killer cell receptor 2B4-like isoform X1 [Triplophysa rosa]